MLARLPHLQRGADAEQIPKAGKDFTATGSSPVLSPAATSIRSTS